MPFIRLFQKFNSSAAPINRAIFDLLRTQAQEENITRYLMDIFWEIVHGTGEILKVDIMELYEEIMRDNQKADEITRLFLPAFERIRAA